MTPTAMLAPRFTFQRFGHSFHVRVENARDLRGLLTLDEAHWIATTAPIETINADPVLLRLLDTDRDGRIRVSEVKGAIQWIFDTLTNPEAIRPGNNRLLLSEVKADTKTGRRILDSAEKIQQILGDPDKSDIYLQEVRSIISEEEKGGLDTAGIVLPAAAPNETIRQFLSDILHTVGGKAHPAEPGAIGVTAESLEQFLQETREFLAWRDRAVAPNAAVPSTILPLGKDTAPTFALLEKLQDKLEQFFLLCDALRLADTQPQLELATKNSAEIDFAEVSTVTTLLEKAPVAAPNPGGILDFSTALNPHYEQDLQRFQKEILQRIFGRKMGKMRKSHWEEVKTAFRPYRDWLARRPPVKVDGLPEARLRDYVKDPQFQKIASALLKESHRTALALDNLRLLEKLILYQAYLIPFVNSFVSFPHLYDPESRALFELGTLIMDGRHFTLAVKVPDRTLHAKFSQVSNMFVLYAEIISSEKQKLYEVAVPVTSGSRGNLHVNKWGIFRDIYGREHHAHIVQIVENPISLGEAVMAPFKRLGRAITTKLEEVTREAQQKLEQQGTQVVQQLKEGTAPPAKRGTGNRDAGTGSLLAGGGIAIAALGSSVAFITKTIADLGWMVMLGGLIGAFLAVMLPAVIVAFLKLQRRDLSSMLEGAGWGLNSRMRLTRRQSLTFTNRPPYPAGSRGLPHRNWWFWLILIPLLGAALYLLFRYQNWF